MVLWCGKACHKQFDRIIVKILKVVTMYCFNIIEDSRVFLFYHYSPFHFKCFLEQKIIFIATISMMRIVQIQCRSFGCVLAGEEPC